jgi:hypothetical protein
VYKLNPRQITIDFTVSNYDLKMNHRVVDYKLAQARDAILKSTFEKESLKKTEDEFSTNYRISLYVATPEEFEAMIHERAKRIAKDMVCKMPGCYFD